MALGVITTEDQKQELVTTLQLLKQSNPQVTEILESLKRVQAEINLLHELKAEHRRYNAIFTLDLQPHCTQCKMWAQRQTTLRAQKSMLSDELYRLSYGITPWKLLEAECYLASKAVEVA